MTEDWPLCPRRHSHWLGRLGTCWPPSLVWSFQLLGEGEMRDRYNKLAASLVRRHINYKWDFSRTCRHPAWPGARGLLPEGGVGGGAAARHDGHHLVGPPVDASQHHPWPISSGELYSWKSVSQNSYLQTISTDKTEMIHVNSTLTPWLHTDSPRKVCE